MYHEVEMEGPLKRRRRSRIDLKHSYRYMRLENPRKVGKRVLHVEAGSKTPRIGLTEAETGPAVSMSHKYDTLKFMWYHFSRIKPPNLFYSMSKHCPSIL